MTKSEIVDTNLGRTSGETLADKVSTSTCRVAFIHEYIVTGTLARGKKAIENIVNIFTNEPLPRTVINHCFMNIQPSAHNLTIDWLIENAR